MDEQEENYFEEDVLDDDFGGQDEFVMGYTEGQERARAGGGDMLTIIEGEGALARAQQRMEQRQASTQLDRRFLSYYNEVRSIYPRFNIDDEVILKDKFNALKNHSFKNPQAFILATIALRESNYSLTHDKVLFAFDLASQTNQLTISEADIVRYCRLILNSS